MGPHQQHASSFGPNSMRRYPCQAGKPFPDKFVSGEFHFPRGRVSILKRAGIRPTPYLLMLGYKGRALRAPLVKGEMFAHSILVSHSRESWIEPLSALPTLQIILNNFSTKTHSSRLHRIQAYSPPQLRTAIEWLLTFLQMHTQN